MCAFKMEDFMVQNIFVGILGLIAVAAGIWVWRVDHGGSFENSEKQDTEQYQDKNNQ